jgi:RNA polymerase sigma-70 factor (ECF subfamily)
MFSGSKNTLLFDEIVKTNYNRVFRLCLRYSGDKEEAQDLTQEVFIKVWSNIKKFRGEAAISTWIYRIASNVCLSSFRDKKKIVTEFQDTSKAIIYDESEDEMVDWDIEEKKLKLLSACLEKLTPEDRTIMSLYLEDVDSKTISEVTGLSDGNIRTRIHRIKVNIKREWERRYGTR